MNFKRFLLHFIIVCMTCTNFFNNIYAENSVSSSAVFYDYDEEEVVEETTETTTVSQEGVSAPAGVPNNFSVMSEGCVLIDANSGIVLYGKNMNDKFYPASITKVLTGLLAVEYGHFDDVITVSWDAVNSIPWDSSKMNLSEDEQLSFENVIYGLMLKSGNDSAMVIAETVAGSVDNFVDMMNERAKEVGAQNTHFANPHGYHDENHYTTPYDMALITKEAVKNDDFNKIWSTQEREVLATNKSERRLMYHSDKMLHSEYTNYYYENLKGGKTGYHADAGNTLVSYASMGKIDLICVVMKEASYGDAYADTKALFDYGFGLYKDTKIYSAENYSESVPVVQYYKERTIELGNVLVAPASDYSAVVPEFIDLSQVQPEYELVQSIEAPVAKGDVVGSVTLKYNGYTLGSLDITAQETVIAIPQSELIKQEKMEAFRKNILRVLSVIAGAIVTVILFILLLKLWFAGRKPKRRKATRRSGYVSQRTRASSQRTARNTASRRNEAVRSRDTARNRTTVRSKDASGGSVRSSGRATSRRTVETTIKNTNERKPKNLQGNSARTIEVNKPKSVKGKKKIKKIKIKF